MKPINLLYVTSSIDSIHDYRILKLHEQNPDINVVLATCDNRKYYFELLNLDITILESREKNLYSDNPILSRLFSEYKHRRFVSFLKQIIKKYRIDIIHSGWLTTDSYDALKTGFHPVLATSWGSDVLNNPYMKNPHTSRRLLRKIRYVARKADAIYSDAEIVAQTIMDLTEIGHDKIHVFPQLGIDRILFKVDDKIRDKIRAHYGFKKSDNVLIMSRSFSPVYAVGDFIMSLPKVIEHVPGTKVLLAGDGPLKHTIIALIEDLKLLDYVTLLGYMPNEQLPEIYNAADIYVSTSLSDGSSLSLMEAMCCGLPVVVTDVPANLEWIREGFNGLIAERKNIDSIADKLITLLTSDGMMKQFADRNLKIAAEKIDIKKNYRKLIALYQFLLNGKSNLNNN